MGLVLFTAFINGIDEVIKCTFSKFADDTKLRGEVDTPEGCIAIQRQAQEVGPWESHEVVLLTPDITALQQSGYFAFLIYLLITTNFSHMPT